MHLLKNGKAPGPARQQEKHHHSTFLVSAYAINTAPHKMALQVLFCASQNNSIRINVPAAQESLLLWPYSGYPPHDSAMAIGCLTELPAQTAGTISEAAGSGSDSPAGNPDCGNPWHKT
ncbi:hypothetical protein [Oceanisphaera psychrotolerans]|uniref:hypothetical protein n=1 Tax=Oceanisphaera psychrotolerans TaxID=1414654 RepID=UPI001113AC2D|nr:hypothetical protein [Oceanisphaera psychrotolerans]